MSDWTPATTATPCEICGRDRYCSRNGSVLRCTKLDAHPTYGQGMRHTDKSGADWWLYRTGDDDHQGKWSLPEPTVEQTHDETLADADILHTAYSALLSGLSLSVGHQSALTRRGLTPEQVGRLRDVHQYRSHGLTGRAEAVAKLIEAGHERHLPHVPGFVVKTNKNGRRYWTLAGSPGMLIPIRDVDGRIGGLKIRKDDASKGGKYAWLTSRKNRDGKVCGVSPGAPVHVPMHDRDRQSIRVTEGPLKADIATMLTGVLTLAIPGVGSWKRVGGVAESIGAKRITIAMDADAVRNVAVARAVEGLTINLPQHGFDVAVERWAEADGKGIDDLLLAGKSPDVVSGAAMHQWAGKIVEGASAGNAGDRVEVLVSADEHVTNRDAVIGLATAEDIYQRAGRLVHIVTDGTSGDITRDGTPQVRALPIAGLRERLAETCFFHVETDDGRSQKAPPRWCVEAIHSRGSWPGVRLLEGVTTSPTLRSDGSIVDEPGYDVATRLLYVPDGEPPIVPTSPTRDDAIQAADELLDVVADFPFAKPEHQSAWLASLLTPIGRPGFRGPSPMFLIDANVRGSGKSLLSDVVGQIVAGSAMPRLTAPRDDDEARKRITAIATAGDRMVLLDNIAGSLGSASLDAAITAETWRDRILGRTEMVEMPLNAVWFATGNNVILQADTARRVCHIRLDSPEESPEERTGFRHPDLRDFVRDNRLSLLTAALTVLRAFIVAGRPQAELTPWGSFEGWSDFVRQAIVWIDLPDPAGTRRELAEQSDRDAIALRQIIAGWDELDPDSYGLMTREIVDRLEKNPDRYDAVRAGLDELCNRGITSRAVGYALRKFKGRTVGGRKLDSKPGRSGSHVWSVSPQNGGDGGDGCDDSAPLRGRNLDIVSYTEVWRIEPGETSPPSQPSPPCGVCGFPMDGDCDGSNCPSRTITANQP